MISVYKWESVEIPEPFMICYDDNIPPITAESLASIERGIVTLMADDALINALKDSNFVHLGDFNSSDDIIKFAKVHYPEDFI